MSKPKGMFLFVLVCLFITFRCSAPQSRREPLSAELPLHLEEHLAAADVQGSDIPKDIPPPVEWRFDQEQPDWKVATYQSPTKIRPAKVIRVKDALRIVLAKENMLPAPAGLLKGGISIDLPHWRPEEWGYFVIRARTAEKITIIEVEINDDVGEENAAVIHDGSVQTYLIRADRPEKEWKRLGLHFHSQEPASIDLLSMSVIPKEVDYAQSKVGVKSEVRDSVYRRTLFTHAPAKLEYLVRISEKGRLDTGLGVLRGDTPVTFKVTTRARDSEARVLFEQKYSDREHWGQRSVDLSSLAGRTVVLTLETAAERDGAVAFWAAPTLTGSKRTKKPNVVFYVIDAGAADHMSVYGYNRRTTPNLERLAAEGAVFEHAYSNSVYTNDSVPSFMTSLQSSVLGRAQTENVPLPDQALTMAQQMHRAGYQTEVLTSNPYCGAMSGLDRGVDVLQDSELGQNISPSRELNKQFWKWREAYPGEPYWTHFQPTDVHMPWKASPPFAGLYVDPEIRSTYEKIFQQLLDFMGNWENRWDSITVEQAKFSHAARGFYDETMAQLDDQIGQLVESLKTAGEWDHTLFIVAADHGHYAGGLPILDPPRPKWETPIMARHKSRIPMIFVSPGKIAPGQRFSQPVSMIDILPTILDLAGLPRPEMIQGQSLAPLLLGQTGWRPRPVIFDEFGVQNNVLYGTIEVVDGRWGASLSIDPRPADQKTPRERSRPAPLLIFDILDDPYCVNSLHRERPDLVEKYTKYLEQVWEEHQTLAKKFTRPGKMPLTPEQIETLRSLGYLR